VPLHHSLFQQVQLHSNNAFYRFLLHVCSVIERNLIVEEEGRGHQFREFLQEEAVMWRLFENFVLNFYDHEQSLYDVDAPHIQWDITGEVPEHMPQMRTDVVLTSPDRTIIIDAKYSKDTLKARNETDLYRSKHLYQLFAYLQNAEADESRFDDAEGMLLYPTMDYDLGDAEPFEVRNHRMRVCTIDLAQDWTDIHDDLLHLVGCPTD
jgi:5-methylcytosine-specific restriction enzyme subunit McrC